MKNQIRQRGKQGGLNGKTIDGENKKERKR
jgi:hypothetical protein